MRKIILALIVSLGLMSCEESEELSSIEIYELYDNYEIYNGLTTIDFANSENGNAELIGVKCTVRLENMRASFIIHNREVVNVESTINNNPVDYEIWRVKVFNLYYNL